MEGISRLFFVSVVRWSCAKVGKYDDMLSLSLKKHYPKLLYVIISCLSLSPYLRISAEKGPQDG